MNGYSEKMIKAMNHLITEGFDEDLICDFLDTFQDEIPAHMDRLVDKFTEYQRNYK